MNEINFKESELINHGLLDNVPWIDANWMFISIGLGALLFLWLLFSPRWSGSLKEKLHDPKWLAFLIVVLYSIHQFEEHAFDIFGRRYMFDAVYNAGTGLRLGIEVLPRPTTWVNLGLIWGVFILWAFASKRENGYYAATFAWGFSLFNGIVGHFLPFFLDSGELKYVPGAIQSIFMVLMAFYVLLVVFKQHGIFKGFVLPILFGILFHLIGLIIPMTLFQGIPEDIRWPLFLGITAVLPLLAMPLLQKVLKLQAWEDEQ